MVVAGAPLQQVEGTARLSAVAWSAGKRGASSRTDRMPSKLSTTIKEQLSTQAGSRLANPPIIGVNANRAKSASIRKLGHAGPITQRNQLGNARHSASQRTIEPIGF